MQVIKWKRPRLQIIKIVPTVVCTRGSSSSLSCRITRFDAERATSSLICQIEKINSLVCTVLQSPPAGHYSFLHHFQKVLPTVRHYSFIRHFPIVCSEVSANDLGTFDHKSPVTRQCDVLALALLFHRNDPQFCERILLKSKVVLH